MGYHGLISLTKCNSSQTLNPILPDSNDQAFKFKKIGGLHVETLHLPPEDSVAKERVVASVQSNVQKSSDVPVSNVAANKIANLF